MPHLRDDRYDTEIRAATVKFAAAVPQDAEERSLCGDQRLLAHWLEHSRLEAS